MNTSTIAITAGLIVVGVVIALRENKHRQRDLASVFSGRESKTEKQFFESYFLSEGVPFNIVSGVRRVLERELDTDLSRLDAADDFSKNLSFFWKYDSMADIEIVVALEKEFNIKITDHEATSTKTVRDLVHLVWNKAKNAA